VRERALKLISLEHRHGITLLHNDILYSRRYILWFREPSRAPMARPSLAVRLIDLHRVKPTASICFEVAHDFLRGHFCTHNHMHMISSHMGRQKIPVSVRTYLLNCLQNHFAPSLIKAIWRLGHPLFFSVD
jgi:hypothetical protein